MTLFPRRRAPALTHPLPAGVAGHPQRVAAARLGLRLLVVTMVGVLVAPTAGCRVDKEEVNNRVYGCNIAAADPGCGTDPNGQPMSCFTARQIGATDFCAEICEAPVDPVSGGDDEPDEGNVCLPSKMALRACKPSNDADKTAHPLGACDRRGLACYRTDLLSDRGVCTTMSPCDSDAKCLDPVRSVCATTFLAELYAGAPDLKRDHMYCLQTGCRLGGTACSPGESCLQQVIPAAAHPPDICVPNCDSAMHCPPNFLCYRGVSTPSAPNVCIPGLLGFTCGSSIDCMLGTCIDNHIGYKVCSATCDSDADCRRFDGEQGKFLCIKAAGNPTAPGYCHTPDSYRGSICDTTDECIPRNRAEECSRFNAKDKNGSCLVPCKPDGTCDPRVGINHTCLPSVVRNKAAGDLPRNVCFPGYFGFPCAGDSNCIGDMTCHPTAPGSPNVCTTTCASTSDCAANRWIAGDGWCHPELKTCLSKLDAGEDCPANEACKSGACSGDRCAAAEGNP